MMNDLELVIESLSPLYFGTKEGWDKREEALAAALRLEATLKAERERTDKLIAEIQSEADYWENKYNSIT
jgi:hypothetical protein